MKAYNKYDKFIRRILAWPCNPD